MRNFKIRAWHKENKKMYELAKVDLWGDPDQATCDLASLDEQLFDVYLSEVILMQYTGLKDRAGAEICEGDIGRWYTDKGNESILFEVLLIEEEARFMGRYKDEYGNYRFISLINSDKGLEIIGNIYEKPELLE